MVTFSSPSAPGGAPSPRDIAAVLQWWRDAGLDQQFSDAPANWLAAPEPEVPVAPQGFTAPLPPSPPPRVMIGGEASEWPQDLAAFQAWWMTDPALDGGQVAGRVPPRGTAQAELMVLCDYPEAGDQDRLLSGAHGKLLDALLAALGLTAAQIYVASVLPRHMPHPDWAALHDAGIADLTRHHIALAAPKRLISFGSHVSSLLGHDPANSPASLPHIFHVGPSIPALAAPGLETLLARPRGKARLWQNLVDWQTF